MAWTPENDVVEVMDTDGVKAVYDKSNHYQLQINKS